MPWSHADKEACHGKAHQGGVSRRGRATARLLLVTVFLVDGPGRGGSVSGRDQYAHVVDLLRTLASEADPRRAVCVTVEPVEDFFELKDKGGVLGKINLRVFFVVVDEERVILVLAAVKKEAMGKTPEWMKIRVRHRLRRFRSGDFGSLEVKAVSRKGKEAKREHG
jgi:hypothetical protein